MKIPKLNKTYRNYLIDRNGCLWEKVDECGVTSVKKYEKREPFLHKGRLTYLLFIENYKSPDLKFSKVHLENAAKLVLNTYYPQKSKLAVVHKDGNLMNLKLKNLEWGLVSEKIHPEVIFC